MTSLPSQPVTERQLAASVMFRRLVIVTNLDMSDVPLTGYVSGWDEMNIFLAIPTDDDGVIRKVLVNRSFIAGIEFPERSTLSTESPETRRVLETLLVDFSKRIIEQYFPDRLDRRGVPKQIFDTRR